MDKLPSKHLQEAVDALSALPTIGKKSALRLAMHLLDTDPGKTHRIARSLEAMIDGVKSCQTCHFISDDTICSICSNPRRDQQLICIVESFRDVLAIESTAQYKGVYHILGGILSPMDGIRPEDLEFDSLRYRIQEGSFKEVILAINPSIEGETTNYYLYKLLSPYELRLSTLARGISYGGELEYADGFTLGHSISSRTPYSMRRD